MKSKHMLAILGVMLVLATAGGTAWGVTLNINPSDDSYVRDGQSEANRLENFGSADLLLVRSQTNWNAKTLLKFKLTDNLNNNLIPNGCTIQSATLQLQLVTAPGGGVPRNYELYLGASDSWNEGTVNYYTAPATTGSALDTVASGASGSIMQWSGLALTTAVDNANQGDKTISLVIQDQVPSGQNAAREAYFASKEQTPGSARIIPVLVVEYTCPITFEGCSHGYWKNHESDWVDYTPSATLGSVFTVPPSLGLSNNNLMQALEFKGGNDLVGGAQILLRDAVASLLNASNPDVNYPMTTANIITDVNSALASNDRDTMLNLAKTLNDNNELGCSLPDDGP